MGEKNKSIMLKRLSIRQLQAYAGACLLMYVGRHGMRNEALFELIEHLFSILSSVDLPNWEQQGSELRLTGQGDPFPPDVLVEIAQKKIDAVKFYAFVDSVVTVGIVDMYGAPTGDPLKFVQQCVDFLLDEQIKPPSLEPLREVLKDRKDVWGDAVDGQLVKKLINHYRLEAMATSTAVQNSKR